MKIPPADADKDRPKMGKEYYWCAKHVRWGGHTKSKCKGMGLDKDPEATQKQPNSPQTMAFLGLSSRALSTIILSDSK